MTFEEFECRQITRQQEYSWEEEINTQVARWGHRPQPALAVPDCVRQAPWLTAAEISQKVSHGFAFQKPLFCDIVPVT